MTATTPGHSETSKFQLHLFVDSTRTPEHRYNNAMGKKGKTGKNRQDKFYHLAKEQGFRSRAAFKLVQLNKKHDFLSSSARGVLDLCAAPGGWMQVARKHMPVGSPCIGIDLVPIRPVAGCVGIIGDITTDSARGDIRRALKQAGVSDEKVDVVLNDGSPNMGKAWLQDAYTQSELTLAALKMAADFLSPGGSFITKVFRSNDYNSLLFVMHQLFSRVDATKPSASRNESAEIYVMCLGFKAPKSIDPRLLSPKYVFKDMSSATNNEDDDEDGEGKGEKKPDLFLNTVMKDMKKQKRNREGYRDGETTFFKKKSVLEFCHTLRPVAMMVDASQFSFEPKLMMEIGVTEEDAKQIARLLEKLEETSSEFLSCCEDLKVLARREFKLLLKWRMVARNVLKKADLLDSHTGEGVDEDMSDVDGSEKGEEGDVGGSNEDADNADEVLDGEMHKARAEVLAVEKRKRRKANKIRSAIQRKIDMKIILPDEEGAATHDTSDALFTLNTAKRAERHGSKMVDVPVDVVDAVVEEEQKMQEEEEGYEGDAEVVGMSIEGEKLLKARRHPNELADTKTAEAKETGEVEDELERWYKLYLKHTKRDKNGLALKESKELKRTTKRKALREAQKKREEETKGGGADAEEGDGEVDVKLVVDSSESSDDDDAVMDEHEDADRGRSIQSREAALWFSQPVFEGIDVDSSDDDFDVNDKAVDVDGDVGGIPEGVDDIPTNDLDVGQDNFHAAAKQEAERIALNQKEDITGEDDGFEVVALEKEKDDDDQGDGSDSSFHSSDYDTDEKAEMMAIGKKMKHSKQEQDEILDEGYHRYTFDDPVELPRWFADQDGEYRERRMPISKEEVAEMKEYIKSLAAAPTKKEAEAKARRRGRLEKKMEVMKTKANNIAEQQDVSVNSRMKAIEDVYKQAMKGGKRAGKKDKRKVYQVVRPNGRMAVGKDAGKDRKALKGTRTTIVDRRLKSDKRGIQKAQKRGKKGKK